MLVKEFEDDIERDRYAGDLGFHKVQYSATTGAGIVTSITERIIANAEIAGTMALHDLFDTAISARLWRVGVNFGCLVRI